MSRKIKEHNRIMQEHILHFLQEDLSRYKKLYQDAFTDRNQYKQQCTQGKNNLLKSESTFSPPVTVLKFDAFFLSPLLQQFVSGTTP